MRYLHAATRILIRVVSPALLPVLLLAGGAVRAQTPYISAVFPAGGQRGATVQGTIMGQRLSGASEVVVSPHDVTVRVVKVVNAANVTVSAVIAPDAALGPHDLRIITAGGASNRYRFFVGQLPEINEKEPNSEKSQAQVLPALPILVNGQITPQDRDYFKFTATAGQTLICAVDARAIQPYLADAVPGWFDACLTLYDPSGKEVAYNDDYRFEPDPMIIYKASVSGDYMLEIRDIIYRGRADFVYRLSIGALPRITHIFPLGGRRGTVTNVALYGENLSTTSTQVRIPLDSPSLATVDATAGALESNRVLFGVGDSPEITETEPNDSFRSANRVQLPVIINGRVDKPGDQDYFAFTAAKGDRVIVDVLARRLGSPLDSIVTLYNDKLKPVAENDDTIDPEFPLVTHQADSHLVYSVPAAGDYYVRLRDIQGKGGEEYAYRLYIGAPNPNFTLETTPDNPRVAGGDSVVITVKALRKDGFNGEIRLAVKNLPPGYVASDAVIGPGQISAPLTITAPPDAGKGYLTPVITGSATIGKRTVTRAAPAIETVMQAFIWNSDIPTREVALTTRPGGGLSLSASRPPTQVLEIPQGGTATVVIHAARAAGSPPDVVDIRPIYQSAAVAVDPLTIAADKAEAPVTITVSKTASPGYQQAIIFSGTTKVGKSSVTRITPAVVVRVVAAPRTRVAKR